MNDRVVVEFAGGLGNQLFQLAAGLHFAAELGCREIQADLRRLRADRQRDFELHRLPLPLVDAEPPLPSAEPGIGGWFSRHLYPHFNKRLPWPLDEANHSGPDLTARGSLWLRGYWQQRELALGARSLIASALADSVSDEVRKRSERLSGAIAMHIRRGDYVSQAASAARHGAQPESYFRDALQRLRLRMGQDCPAAIFSDDPMWVEATFGDLYKAHVQPTGDAVDDLYLMSRCDAFITSNSSYSWWAATLSGSSLLIAPQRWFADESPEPDLFSSMWTRM